MVPNINENIDSERRDKIVNLINHFGLDLVLDTIDTVSETKFLLGDNQNTWAISFDWFITKSNFTKIIEGNYLDKEKLMDELLQKKREENERLLMEILAEKDAEDR